MNLKYLIIKEFTRFMNETDLTVGEILRAITSEKFTGIEITNRGRFSEISDEEWYKIIENAYEYEQE